MNILSILKKKYQKEIEQREEGKRQRRQLNMMVDERLINETKELAAEFTVPCYCLIEHLLETGYHYQQDSIKICPVLFYSEKTHFWVTYASNCHCTIASFMT
jgi:hypothetical protein